MREISRQLFDENLEKNKGSVDRALSETIQSISLLGLSRTDFFTKAAFYGGTALRILFGLNRFSEDLDFSLLKPAADFSLSSYFKSLTNELQAFGFTVDISSKNKTVDTPIDSAFIKANTRIHIIKAGVPSPIAEAIHRNAVCKVKLEIDTDPPPGADFLVSYIDEPVPFSMKAYSGPALFAGKMDAVLSRGWKKRVKGRDWYDFAFLVRKKIPLLLPHLEARLRQKKLYLDDSPLNEIKLTNLIKKRIETVDLEEAKKDILPFINDPREVDIWSVDYFKHVLKNITFSTS